jgi:hypothetical protein
VLRRSRRIGLAGGCSARAAIRFISARAIAACSRYGVESTTIAAIRTA